MPRNDDVRRIVKQVLREAPVTGTIYSLDGARAAVRFGSSPTLVRDVQIMGDESLLKVGSVVFVVWGTDGRPVIQASGAGTSAINVVVGGEGGTGTTVKEGAGIDVVSSRVGLGGDTILIYRANRTPVIEFDPSDVGLDQALAALAAGDSLTVPPKSLFVQAHTLTAGAAYDFAGALFTAPVTLALGALESPVRNLVVEVSGASAEPLYAIRAPAALGDVHLIRCRGLAHNSTGNAYGLYTQDGDIGTVFAENCTWIGNAPSGTGFGVYRWPASPADIYLESGWAWGSTDMYSE